MSKPKLTRKTLLRFIQEENEGDPITCNGALEIFGHVYMVKIVKDFIIKKPYDDPFTHSYVYDIEGTTFLFEVTNNSWEESGIKDKVCKLIIDGYKQVPIYKKVEE